MVTRSVAVIPLLSVIFSWNLYTPSDKPETFVTAEDGLPMAPVPGPDIFVHV